MNFRSAILVAVLLAATQTRGSVVNDGTTRAQQTAYDPAFEGFVASATVFVYGDLNPYNITVTHLWGRYYAAAAHEVTGAFSMGQIYFGSDYFTDPGAPIGIVAVNVSPSSDFAIITASTADDSPRSSTSKLVGITVARQGGPLDLDGGTIVNYFATPQNLQFINQITGTNLTMNDIVAGNSIFAAPQVGMLVRGRGFGAWGNFSSGLNNPDGKAGEWWSSVDGNAPILLGYVDTNFYVLAKRTQDPLGGVPGSLDSGSPVITIVPEIPFRILGVTVTNADVQLVWQGKGGTNYVVQASRALGGTNTFTDLSGVITLPGSGPVTTNYLDAGALTNFPTRFYRIRTN